MLKVIIQNGKTRIEVRDYWIDKDGFIYGINDLHDNYDATVLGEYEDEERAKEVFNKMVKFEESSAFIIKEGLGYRILSRTFEMPKE